VLNRLRWVEAGCWAVGLVCVLTCGFAWEQAHLTAVAARGETSAAAGSAAHSAAFSTEVPRQDVGDGHASDEDHGQAGAVLGTVSGTVLGELSIPALRLSVPIVEDDTTVDLLRGVGHIRGTAMPGGLGTVALAGHRDTFLRPLEHIGRNMQVLVSHGSARYQYRVDSTEIVQPDAVRVLATEDTPELVLITCYPFHYIGAAPLRFIVRAHLVSVVPDSTSDTGPAL
jgi:sortase A